MTRVETCGAVDANVANAWECASVCGRDGWVGFVCCGRLSLAGLAALVRARPERSAASLYAIVHPSAGERGWRDLQPPLRVSLEIFRATLLTLDRLTAGA